MITLPPFTGKFLEPFTTYDWSWVSLNQNEIILNYNCSGLPPGLLYNTIDGSFFSTPNKVGNFNVFLGYTTFNTETKATIKNWSAASTIFVIGPSKPVFLANQNRQVALGSPFIFLPEYLMPEGRPVTSIEVIGGSLPPGCSIDSRESSFIKGTPTAHGTYSFQLMATGPGGISDPVTVSIVVSVRKPLLFQKYYSIKVGESFSRPGSSFLSSDPDRPVTSFAVDQLPDGLFLNTSTGEITGTPQKIGWSVSLLRATGPGGVSDPVSLTWNIQLADPNLPKKYFRLKVGEAFSQTLPSKLSWEFNSSNGGTVNKWNVSPLPPGLVFDETTFIISGTPTEKRVAFNSRSSGKIVEGYLNGFLKEAYIYGDLCFIIDDGVPIISPSQNSSGKLGVPFSKKYVATDTANRPVTSWAAVSLPTWAALNTATGEVTGTPTEFGSTSVTLTATGPGGTSDPVTFGIGVSYGAATITPSQTFTAKAGQVFSATPTLTAGSDVASTTWSHGIIPSWASINPTTGEITGRPEFAKTDTIELIASNEYGSDTKIVSIVVAKGSPLIARSQKLSFKQGVETSIQLQSALPLEDYPITEWTCNDLPSWATLSLSGTITATAPISGASTEIHVTATGPGGTDTTSVILECFSQIPSLVTTSLSFIWGEYQEHSLEFADPVNGKATAVYAVPKLPNGLGMSIDGKIFGSPSGEIGAGSYTIFFSNAVGKSSAPISISITAGAPKIENQTFRGVAGKPFSANLIFDSGTGNRPVTLWSSSDIPTWLNLDSTTGVITGTPINPITATFSVAATGPGGTDTASVTVIVGLPVAIPVAASYTLSFGQTVNETLSLVTAGRALPTEVTASALPPGIKFENGKFTGAALQAGNFTTTVTAKNSSDSESAEIIFSVAFAAPIISAGQAFTGKTDRKLSFQVATENTSSRPVETWTADRLPAGLSINSRGVISGILQSNYNGTIQVTAFNKYGSDSKIIPIKITGPIFYGDKNPVLQPGRVVKTFPSGLVMVSERYLMRPQNETIARSNFAMGKSLNTESTAQGDLIIFPDPDFKSVESGFVEMVVSAYGITGSSQTKTARRLQSATISIFENNTVITRQEKVLANTHTIRVAVPSGTQVSAPSGGHGVSPKPGFSLNATEVIERYDVQNFGSFDEVTVTTAYEIVFSK